MSSRFALDGVLRNRVILDLGDVGRTRPGFDGVVELGVLLGVGADVLQIDLDAGLLLIVLGHLGQRRLPCPDGDLLDVAFLSRLLRRRIGASARGQRHQHCRGTDHCDDLLGELHCSFLFVISGSSAGYLAVASMWSPTYDSEPSTN